jgi:hypothetical protein
MAKEQSALASAAQARRSFEQIFPASLLPAHHFEPVVYGGSIRWAVLLGLEFCIVPIGAADEKKVSKSLWIIFSSAAVGARGTGGRRLSPGGRGHAGRRSGGFCTRCAYLHCACVRAHRCCASKSGISPS